MHLLSVYSKPGKWCVKRDSESLIGPSIYQENVPFQKLNCYNTIHNDNHKEELMSCICVSYFNDEAYVSSDSLNIIIDENGKEKERKMIKKIFQKNNILIAHCGITTFGKEGFEIGGRIEDAKIENIDDFYNFYVSLINPYKERVKLLHNFPQIMGFELIMLENYKNSINIVSHGFNMLEEKHHIMSKYQTGIWGSSKRRYRNFDEEVEKEPEKNMKKIIEYNYGKTVGGPIQMFKMPEEGEILNLSEPPFDK